MSQRVEPTKNEVFFDTEGIIVSKTDRQGRILYANDLFLSVAGYTESEVLGKPHSLIRHPEMPRAVFKLLWDTIDSGSEIFAYVKNITKAGDYYWVIAHVTPSFNDRGDIVGYHSNRRCPTRESVEFITPIYQQLLDEERRHRDRREGLAASTNMLLDFLEQHEVSYPEFIFGSLKGLE